jgi:hypothetical protein
MKENIPHEIPLKGCSEANRSDRFPSGNQLKIDSEILKFVPRTNIRDMFKRCPNISFFSEKSKASTLFPKKHFLHEW